MDPRLFNPESFRIEHRHRDGTWAPLEPLHHGEAEHDAERSWLRRRVFRCTKCQQQVDVTIEPVHPDPASA